jgi:VCBS repeat-containing protein
LNLSLHEANGNAINVLGINVGTKSAGTCHYDCFVTMSDHSYVQVANDLAIGKNGVIHVVDPNQNDNLLIESVTIFKVDGNAVKIGLGDIQFLLPPDDVQLSFAVRLTDGDNDFVGQNFTVSIDGNNDGSITNPVSAASLAKAADLSQLSSAQVDSFAMMRPEHFTGDIFLM